MKSFHTIAVPHADILEGRLSMDIWAAKLWEVYKDRGPDEYRDATQFFTKTYTTDGLKHLMTVVKQRLAGKGGDPVIQIQTPFGGGKTHSLIAIYHDNTDAKRIVLDGVYLSASDTLWGLVEKQITGKIELCNGLISPGAETLQKLLEPHQPVLIMMDELLEYVTKAAAVKVGDTNLAEQTLAFLQELTTVASALSQVSILLTLPSSDLEHYSEQSERFLAQLAHVVGRMERIYTPVQESEITSIIRRRLFSRVDDDQAANVIKMFMGYAERESMLPPGEEPSEYRKRFELSYPFMPEVVDTLYHRWGSFPNFQRTRGVLRLLALVIHSMKDKDAAYISLSDFKLADSELLRELIKHIGQEYDSIVSADVTGSNANTKRIDNTLGDSYRGLKLGTRAAIAIFMNSFSGKDEIGATLGEIKRSATTLNNPSSVVAEALEKLKDSLFYTQYESGKYFFSNQPNLNRVLVQRMENVTPRDLQEFEEDILLRNLKGKKLPVVRISDQARPEVPDDKNLKLVVMSSKDDNLIKDLFDRKGTTPRVHRNTLFFLVPVESEKNSFTNQLRRTVAYRSIKSDKKLKLTEDQQKQITNELKRLEEGLDDSLRRFYRWILIPARSDFKEIDLGIPTFGDNTPLNDLIYDKLRSDSAILENLSPKYIETRYLQGSEGYVLTEQLHPSTLKTPGEPRPVNQDIWRKAIVEGVKQGLFGLGTVEGSNIVCTYFKEDPDILFAGDEALIHQKHCNKPKAGPATEPPTYPVEKPDDIRTGSDHQRGPETKKVPFDLSDRSSTGIDSLILDATIPYGKVSALMGVLNLLQNKFSNLEVSIKASDGNITQEDYESKILEAFDQSGIRLK